MSSESTPVEGANPVPGEENPVTNATNAPTGQAAAGYIGATVNSLDEIKKKAPEFYKAMMEGLAIHITSEMKDAETRRKQRKKEYERD
jgi:hypothetical protein